MMEDLLITKLSRHSVTFVLLLAPSFYSCSATEDADGSSSKGSPTAATSNETMVVKIRCDGDDKAGSGLVINQQGTMLTVLTNYHVVMGCTRPLVYAPPHWPKAQKAAGKVTTSFTAQQGRQGLSACEHAVAASPPMDLALLTVSVPTGVNVNVADISTTPPSPGDKVNHEGYEVKSENVTKTSAEVFKMLSECGVKKIIQGGYDLVYTGSIEKPGMSGGPLVDTTTGKVVGLGGHVDGNDLLQDGTCLADGTAAPDGYSCFPQAPWSGAISADQLRKFLIQNGVENPSRNSGIVVPEEFQ